MQIFSLEAKEEYLCSFLSFCGSRFHQKNSGFTLREEGDKDSSLRCEPTEHNPELQVEAQMSHNAPNIALCVNSQH